MDLPIIYWFRRNLRLTDNTALYAAVQTNKPVIPIFIFDPVIIKSQRLSIPRLAWLLKSLKALDTALRGQGSYLLVAYGSPYKVLEALVETSQAQALYFTRDYTPFAVKRDAEIEQKLVISVQPFDDAALLPPGKVLTNEGKPFTVFTPFKRKWLMIPKVMMEPYAQVASPHLALELLPVKAVRKGLSDDTIMWLDGVPSLHDFGQHEPFELPEAGEDAAEKRLNNFLNSKIQEYDSGRNHLAALPGDDMATGSSFLSPYLRFGSLSPRQAYWGAREAYTKALPTEGHSIESWVSELIWRDFYMHILFHFPQVLKSSFRPAYDGIEWRDVPDELQAWKDGMTGYPVVDAAMRQLRQMGWMPNRARMIVASFLSKDLLIHWREGERYFMDWLIDGDPAANNGGWQWSAGTGTDAQPYFRIFNPVSQSKQFDPDGVYIRRWIAELHDVPTEYIHTPWLIDVLPGKYPAPIVDHQFARERALRAFKGIKA